MNVAPAFRRACVSSMIADTRSGLNKLELTRGACDTGGEACATGPASFAGLSAVEVAACNWSPVSHEPDRPRRSRRHQREVTIKIPVTKRRVIAAAGYERSPGSSVDLGIVSGFRSAWLGSPHSSPLLSGFLSPDERARQFKIAARLRRSHRAPIPCGPVGSASASENRSTLFNNPA